MKKLITLVISVFVFSCACAQVEIEWQKTIGGSAADLLICIKKTSDGGYILGGNSQSNASSDKTQNSKGNFDYWIVKTDSSGNIQWDKTIGGNGRDIFRSLQQTTDGGYILGGYSDSDISGDKTENSKGGADYWVVKTDSLGNIEWENTIGGDNVDNLNSIEQTTDGGYILGGWSGSDSSDDKTEYSSWLGDIWIVKIDSIGNIQWQNSIGGTNSDFLNCLHQTSDGGFILGGQSKSNISGDKTENSRGDYDYWIVKTDSIGNIQWDKTIGGDTMEYMNAIRQTSDGGYILGGISCSNISGDKTENDLGQHMLQDYWIVKTDSSGNIQWQNTIGGNRNDWLNSLQQTSDGGYILGGSSNSNGGGDKTERSRCPDSDFWIVKIDNSGNIEWDKTIGGSSNNCLNSVEQTSDGNYILGGYSMSDISGDKSENSKGKYDYWIVKLTDKYNLIKGRAFIDFNSNAVKDSNDILLQGELIAESNTNRIAFTGKYGKYSLAVLDSGNYSVFPKSINYYNALPVAHSANFNGINQTDSLNNFAFQPIAAINDLQISITPLTPFRTGFNGSYLLHYKNVGTTTLSTSIVLYLNSILCNYSSASVAPAFVSADSVIWNNITLAPFQEGSLTVSIYVNTGISNGTPINAICVINPVVGDAFVNDNYASWRSIVTGPTDPNDKLVSDSTVTVAELTTSPYLDYVIRFQNTGNDTAFNVRIADNIPIDLDITSLQLVASSHPFDLTYEAHSRFMTFAFNNILLPDSGTNQLASHGFIRYRIKPIPSLVAGDTIKNSAFIYFDFNAPVQTNWAETKIISLYGTNISGILSSCFDSSAIHNYITPANTAHNYLWTAIGGTIISGQGTNSVNVQWQTPGTDKLKVTECDSAMSYCESDSVILFIAPNFNASYNTSICQGDSVFLSGSWQTNSGNYIDSLTSVFGCDSIIQTALILNPVYLSTDSVSLLLGDSIFIGGAWQTQAGVYIDNLQTQFGCDSLVTTVVNIITSIDNIQSSSIILIRPNPTSGNVMIELKIPTNVIANLTIQDLHGKLILKDQVKSNEKKLFDISSFKNGVYIVKIMYNGKMHYCKLVKS